MTEERYLDNVLESTMNLFDGGYPMRDDHDERQLRTTLETVRTILLDGGRWPSGKSPRRALVVFIEESLMFGEGVSDTQEAGAVKPRP